MTEQLSFVLIKVLFIFLLIWGNNLFANTVYFAGGCFWCTEKSFENFPGVNEAISGYCNGTKETASYSLVSSGKTDHRECVQIKYDQQATDLEKLLINYLKSINPLDLDGQFADRGNQYRIEIYYVNDEQKKIFQKTMDVINKKNIYEATISIPIREFKAFFAAEEYHQDYYKKNPRHYNSYEEGSGRKNFLNKYIERFNQ